VIDVRRLLACGGALSAALVVTATAGGPDRSVPAPAQALGFEPCADYKLATYEAIAGYFRSLAAAAPDRMRLVDIGRTVEGRAELMAVITSEENLRRLERYKDISRSLALTRHRGRPVVEEQARALAAEGRVVVWIDFGLHSSEVADAQAAPLLAHKVVASESDELRAIRDNVILLLVPNMNPDGTTMVANWYMRHVGTPWEDRLPELWHTYAGHDNNRDWFMMTQPETRNATRQLYVEWFPRIVYDQHQAGPYPSRIFVPPFEEPTNPNIPALVMKGVDLVGAAIMQRLDREGKRGVLTRVGFDSWWNGGMRTVPYFHNMVGILTETAHPSATPTVNDPQTFPRQFPTGRSTETPSPDYPNPYLGGRWQMRQSCDYIVSSSLAVLDVAARRRADWLYDAYRAGRDTMMANARETFLIPADQWDVGSAARLVNTLRLGGVEIERALAPFAVGGSRYDTGTFVVRGAQPFAPYVRDLLTAQAYPDVRLYAGGPSKTPYDITGWTLPLQMGVKVDRVTEPVTARTAQVRVAPVSQWRPPRTPGQVALDPRANDSFIAVNRLLRLGGQVSRLATSLELPGVRWPAGAFVVERASVTEPIGRSLDLSAASVSLRLPAMLIQRAPRIGVYHAWGGNIDEGWTRWVLEQFEFPYVRVHDQAVRSGALNDKFDVIVLPDATYRQMREGFRPGTMPEAYAGGMTERGVANLREFVQQGGTLVALARAAELPVLAFGLPVRDVTAGQPTSLLSVPGAILNLTVDPSHPVGFGMPASTAAFVSESPAFAVAEPSDRSASSGVRVIGRYPSNRLLLSGWLQGEGVLANRAVVLEFPLGSGRVILLAVRTQHRGQAQTTFKLLFNSLYISVLGPSRLG
jgi:hypothetical protein